MLRDHLRRALLRWVRGAMFGQPLLAHPAERGGIRTANYPHSGDDDDRDRHDDEADDEQHRVLAVTGSFFSAYGDRCMSTTPCLFACAHPPERVNTVGSSRQLCRFAALMISHRRGLSRMVRRSTRVGERHRKRCAHRDGRRSLRHRSADHAFCEKLPTTSVVRFAATRRASSRRAGARSPG